MKYFSAFALYNYDIKLTIIFMNQKIINFLYFKKYHKKNIISLFIKIILIFLQFIKKKYLIFTIMSNKIP